MWLSRRSAGGKPGGLPGRERFGDGGSCVTRGTGGLATHESDEALFFFFLSLYFYPGWHPCGQAGWLSTTQVFKGSLLPESGIDEKEK